VKRGAAPATLVSLPVILAMAVVGLMASSGGQARASWHHLPPRPKSGRAGFDYDLDLVRDLEGPKQP
jgi:hypothetical protein